MKKIVALVLVLLSFVSVSFAKTEFELSGLTYDELVALKDQINLAIWNSEEWQEVEVPQGVWTVGEDIPAGHWTVKCAPEWRSTLIHWGEYLNSSGEDISWNGKNSVYNDVYNPKHKYYEIGDGVTEYNFTVEDGMYIVIDDGSAIFMPYHGKPSLGFK